MDFWSRLIAGTPLSSASANKAASQNPEKRLARFKREFNHLLQIWRGSKNLSRDQDAAEAVRACLQELTAILSDESRRPSPHLCISFASEKQIYIPIGKIATTSYNEPIIREAVACFTTLIESEEEDFVENEAFSKSLMNLLIRITGANSIRLSSETEVEVVELAFGIAAKIRLQPEILPAWFRTHTQAHTDARDAHEKFTGKTHKEDFPLFYLLIDYIHHEGRIGDFARTGLLYVIESASTSVDLEQWIVESDLATLMATGLGALYSQLSRKLVIDYAPDELPSVLALSDYEHPVSTHEIVSSASTDFQGHMETFLSHLVFWQDVLDHCKSIEVKQTLLEHFQVIFLQQLLYPSLLESSDIDGGSSVAVLTYLRQILEALEHPDMIHLILHYLLALPESPSIRRTGSSASVSAARKRKSMDLAAMMAVQTQSNPILYNLVDLILGSLRSTNQQTISVTLRLVSAILRRHHRYAVTTLLRTGRILADEPKKTIGAHDTDMEFLLSLVNDMGGEDSFDQAYENHVKDCMSLLESHPCSQELIIPESASTNTKLPGSHASIPGAPRDVQMHTLRPEDPLLKGLLQILEKFLINPVETNLSLTQTIVDLAACGFMDISGWLLPDSAKYIYDEDEDDYDETLVIGTSQEDIEEAQLLAIRKARRSPNWAKTTMPPLLQHLKLLVEQVSIYRAEIPRFDELLSKRRETFNSLPPPSTANTPKPSRRRDHGRSSFESSTSRSASPPPSRPSAFDSLAQRIFPELATPSRGSSPRGRQSQDPSRSSGSNTYGTSTPNQTPLPNRQGNLPPAQFPMGLETPRVVAEGSSRGSSRAFSPSPLRRDDTGSGAEESQAAAFREIERSILARRVGIPGTKAEIQAIPFKLGAPKPRNSAANNDPVGVSNEEVAEGSSEPIPENLDEEEATEEEEDKKVSVSHILTNIVVLQEFLLELAALVQVRAGLFGEIRFV